MKKIIIIFAIIVALIVAWLLILSSWYPETKSPNVDNNANKSAESATDKTNSNAASNKKTASQDDIAETSLKMEVGTADSFNIALPKYFPEVKNNDLMLVTFTDKDGKVFDAGKALKDFNINLPKELTDGATVRIYIYKGNKDFGPSEAMVVENSNAHLENIGIMKNWEKKMTNDIKAFILAGEKYDLIKSSSADTFSDSYYYRNGRYINYTNDKTVSLNYIVEGKYIVLANSFSILHALVPRIFSL